MFLIILKFKQKIKLMLELIVCMLILLIFLSVPIQGIFSQIAREIDSIADISLISARLNIMRNGIYFLLSKSVFGVGAGNFEYYMKNFAVYNTKGIINSHKLVA